MDRARIGILPAEKNKDGEIDFNEVARQEKVSCFSRYPALDYAAASMGKVKKMRKAVFCNRAGELLLLSFVFQMAFAMNTSARADTGSKNAHSGKMLNEVVVVGEKPRPYGPFLEPVSGTKINAGKKTSNIYLTEIPEITNNNYRQALSKTPGLLLSEETTPLFSLGYRGLAPDRAQFMQVMKDGVPIAADIVGYPEAYYTPLLQTVENIEFIRGGSALQYGTQPGGALNYRSWDPATDTKARLRTENVFGTDSYFSTYESFTGTIGPLGYYGYFHERQSNGFRKSNSDYEVIGSGVKATINQTSDSRLALNYDEYHEEHGEPGGLSLTSTTNPTYLQDRSFTTREHDRFRLERYYGVVSYEKEFSDETQLDAKVFGGHYRRYSKRQRTSGSAFGNLPSGANAGTNDIQEQDFYNVGWEERLRHTYELFGQEHTVSVGTLAYLSHSPREESRGAHPSADVGALRKSNERDIWYFAVFLEHLIQIGKLKITPGVRLEHIWQRVKEKFNLDKTSAPLAHEFEFDFVPLFGGGLSYELWKDIEAYANISQSYRPKLFAETVPTGTNQVVNGDLEPGKAVQYDFGLRGSPAPFFHWDADYFLLVFKDQVGTIGNSVQNVGDSLHQGMELAAEFDLAGALDRLNGQKYSEQYGSLSTFASLTLENAEFYAGPSDSFKAQYAPAYNFRTGVQYAWRDRIKVNLTGTFVGEHFADDSETANRFIPSYKIWDLTAEALLAKNVLDHVDVGLVGGINNIFDEEYYARITSSGIDPAYRRNLYGGVKVTVG